MSDPVSWLQIEKAWTVVASGGEEIGHVATVTGDQGSDIFDGLAVKTPAGVRYVPGEQVGEIVVGTVTLKITLSEAGTLEAYEAPPPEIVISGEKASLGTRLGTWFRGGR